MAKKDKDKIKELGDQKLVAEIEKLQNKFLWNKILTKYFRFIRR